MAPKAVRAPTRKAAVVSPAAQRVGHLLEGARTYADSSPQLAAFLGRRALQVAAESDGPVLPRGAASSLCTKCGLPFTSHVYKGAAVVTLSHQHVRRRLRKAAADAAKGKPAQPVNRAALRYTCQLCGHAALRKFLTRQAAEEVHQKTLAQQERLASSGGAPGLAAAPREAASNPAASAAAAPRQAPPAQVAAPAPARAKELEAGAPAAPASAAPGSHLRAEPSEEAGRLGAAAELATDAAMLDGGAAVSDAVDGGLGSAALGTERAERCEPGTASASPPSLPQPAEEQEQLQEQQERGGQDAAAEEAHPEPEPKPRKRRRISWDPKLEHVRSFEADRSSAAGSESPEAQAAAATAAALGRRLLWKSWFRIGRVWKVARQ